VYQQAINGSIVEAFTRGYIGPSSWSKDGFNFHERNPSNWLFFKNYIFITLMLDFIILRCSGWMESMLYYHCATLVQVECGNLKELEELSSCPLGPHQQSNGAIVWNGIIFSKTINLVIFKRPRSWYSWNKNAALSILINW
jgi:hypothetical protein